MRPIRLSSFFAAARPGRIPAVIGVGLVAALSGLVLLVPLVRPIALAGAAMPSAVVLGTDEPFALLASSTITNTDSSVIDGDLGVSPGTSITGFPPGVFTGTEDTGDAVAADAQSDLQTAYTDAFHRAPDAALPADVGGVTLDPGVYNAPAPLGLTGTLTLDGQNNPDAVFIIQTSSTLITAANSVVDLTNGTQACNVFWAVGSSATIGAATMFAGNLLVSASTSSGAGTTVLGRILALTGAITLDDTTVTVPVCSTTTVTTTTTTVPSGPVTTTSVPAGTTTTAMPVGPVTTTSVPAGTTTTAMPVGPVTTTSLAAGTNGAGPGTTPATILATPTTVAPVGPLPGSTGSSTTTAPLSVSPTTTISPLQTAVPTSSIPSASPVGGPSKSSPSNTDGAQAGTGGAAGATPSAGMLAFTGIYATRMAEIALMMIALGGLAAVISKSVTGRKNRRSGEASDG